MFKATVIVKRKPAILDPQGKAAQQGARLLGFNNVRNTRINKFIEFEIVTEDETQARKEVEAYCEKLLTNPLIEDFEYKLNKIK